MIVALNMVSVKRRNKDLMDVGLSGDHGARKGSSHWYVLHMPMSREVALCGKIRSLIPTSQLVDVFSLRKERWMKRNGIWFVEPVVAYPGYAFAMTSDILGLEKALSELMLPVELVGADSDSISFISDEAADWYDRVTDAGHVIRSSTAVIVDGTLHITDGPLVGQEESVIKINRHRRTCLVSVDEGAIVERCPLDIPIKS